jgi:hypothetical protein
MTNVPSTGPSSGPSTPPDVLPSLIGGHDVVEAGDVMLDKRAPHDG